MIRRYMFAAPPHHVFRAGAAACQGGEEIELEESLATDPRLVPVLDEQELEQLGEELGGETGWRNPGEAHSGGVVGHHADLLANPVEPAVEAEVEDPGEAVNAETGQVTPGGEALLGVDRSQMVTVSGREGDEQLERDDVDDRDDEEPGMPRPRP